MNALVVFLFALVAVAAAAPPPPPPPPSSTPAHEEPIAIVSQESSLNPDGSYVNKFETANGISVSEEGVMEADQEGHPIPFVNGKSSYEAPDGTRIETTWTAGKDGFVAFGAHLPVAPEIPPYIVKSLEWQAAHPYVEEEEKVVEQPKKL